MNRRVDQKLHLAKLSLATLNANSSTEITASAKLTLIEAALFHLHVAYRSYLHELFFNFKLAMNVDTAQEAAAVLQSQQLRSSDIDELVKLEQSGAWPAQLQTAYDIAANVESAPELIANAGIALRDISAQADEKLLESWLQQFHTLLQRQREHAHEW